ncbi:MAG: hypothetical protein C5S40_06045 [ANME-2 cluster archaeon]|nr:hypothetical protein [ANME-2 cluster archaeon]
MKEKIIISLMFVLLIFPFVNADVIPENSHPLTKCIRIVNLDEFPDVYLIGYITGPMVEGHETYIVENDKCLTIGYKFNNLKILAANKTYIDSVGLTNLKVKKVEIPGECTGGCYTEELSDENVLMSDVKIYPYGGYVYEDNPLIKEEIEYSIAGFADNKLILYSSKQTSEYNDGTPKKTEIFEKPNIKNINLTIQNNVSPGPTHVPEKYGFWSKVVCFIKELFGRSCNNAI